MTAPRQVIADSASDASALGKWAIGNSAPQGHAIRVGIRVAVAAAVLMVSACAASTAPSSSPPATTPSSSPGQSGSKPETGTTNGPSTGGSTTSTLPTPPPALATVAYDNTAAARACTLLAPAEIQAQFGAPVAAGLPIDPFCWWKVGSNGFVALTIYETKPISTFRAYSGLNVGDVPDLGDSAFFASNKTLFVGVQARTYVVQFERGAEWIDSNRPKLVVLAQTMLDRLGFVAPPKPTTTTTTSTTSIPPPSPDDPPPPTSPPPPTTVPPPTTTTTRPKPPPVPAPAPIPRPTAPIDLARPITAQAPLRLWVGGDSIAAGPSWAVGEAASKTGMVATDTEFEVGTGLSRPDFFDWYRHLAAVADARDPEVMILLFGGNDIQPLDLPGGGQVAYGDPAWLGEYRRRVAQIMDTLAVRGRRVVWVGTPPMQAAAYNAQMASLNEIYSSEATRRSPWVSYFDAWTMFSPPGEIGVFSRTLPDANGAPQSVRFDDIHYDIRGSELLAAALLDRVRTFARVP